MASVAIATKSATLPAQLYEVAAAVQAAELAANANPINTANPLFEALNNVTIDTDFEAGTVSVTATLPMVPSISGSGAITLTVSDYIP